MFAAAVLRGDERTQRLAIRLAEEAAAFERVAPQVLGVETLEQRAQKRPRRFWLRFGQSARRPPEPVWQERRLVSEYALTRIDGSLHELRQVTAVDGRAVTRQGPDALARVILARDEGRKRELLRQFEDYGLLGGVTDFGPVLLLFTPSAIGRYEFSYLRQGVIDNTPALVFSYKQLDGRGALTLFEGSGMKALALAGEVWVRADYLPLRVTVDVESAGLRQQAVVDYSLSRFGALLPVGIQHRETRAGKLTAEHHFSYTDFKRFGASADIVFEPEDAGK